MTFGKITTRDEHHWQLRAAQVLARLLKHGYDAELPALMWTVTSTGTLIGEASVLQPNADRRAAFEAWAQLLGRHGDRWPEHDRMNGGTHLHLTFSYPTNRGDAKGAIRANLDPADDL